MQNKAIAYIRVSTAGQADEGVSLAAQREKIAAYCLANDLELLEIFEDAGISGSRADNRQNLQSAINAACQAKSALIVYSLSRMSRSTRDTITIAEQLDQAGADLVSLSEKIDTTSAAGRMVFRMLAVLSEFERDQLAERTRAALRFKKGNGERVGNIEFGYKLDPNDHSRLVEDEREQKIIAIITELRSRGLSIRKIIAELQTRQIKPRTGHTWSTCTISRIIKRAA